MSRCSCTSGSVPARTSSTSRRANVYRIQDDKIVEIRIFEADQYAIDTWFSSAQPDAEPPVE
jgi:hypothetical protein